MTTRAKLLESIAKTITDYREGEIPKPTPEHVERWVNQFDEDVQLTLLQELDHILKVTYLSKEWVVDFLTQLVKTEKLAGTNPCDFWKSVNFLNIQQNGHSQEEMLGVFAEALQAQCNLKLEDCGSSSGSYVYLDDALFTGFHVGDDLERWLDQEAPEKSRVYILIIASHKLGEWQTLERLKKQAKESGKDIRFDYWRAISYENRKRYCDNSEVLWPAVLPSDESLQSYMAEEQKYPFEPRKAGGTCEHEIFSCEEGRQLLETQLLLAGRKIRSLCENPSPSLRPLGFSPFGLGFGATVVTFRNCPNNCPLALWWGDPEADESSPLSKWYPLLPRKTYGEDNGFGEIYFE
ncbi:MAG: hypothetical protein R6V59_08975 [Dehalococcoidia bacterium]